MKKTFLVIFIILILGCTAKKESVSNEDLPDLNISFRDFKVGIAGLVWRGYPESSDENFKDFLDELPKLGEYSGIYVRWDDPGLINQINIIKQYSNVEPLIAIGFKHELVNDSYFEIHGKDYKNMVLEVVNNNDLEYLGIGVEVNILFYLISPKSFNDFVILYKEIYDEVKILSPETKVYTIFNLDTLRGDAYLTGKDLSPKWELIDEFEDKLDLVGFTVYPFLNYSSVNEIPADYFSEINNYVSKPLIITESGWLSEQIVINDKVIVKGGEEEQKEFIIKLIESANVLDVEVLMYAFLYEAIQEIELFNTLGLRKNSGEAKQAYYYWRALKELQKI